MSVTFPSSGCPSFFHHLKEGGIVMKLTIYYNGQFWVGVIEVVKNGKLKASQHLFGKEPKDSEVFDFVNRQLLKTLSQSEQEGVRVKAQDQKKINPKRLQRQVSKELKRAGASLKAQDAMKQELEAKKQKKKQITKEQREKIKEQKYLLRKQKAKKKHRGK
ncbi:YjdF family protein [Bacillus halotolerans]|uniref:YjdF family protein n=1 Tax=Bacillus halotolerans TaxID=260554 RepID=UPI002DB79F24|nr:YjdF family protein [Bacillus halotolerans]MEC1647456.1 YjdF family protein [Bacillus halotolerans]MEC3759357.1 YjdF family protein [Bacillus halotolerans]